MQRAKRFLYSGCWSHDLWRKIPNPKTWPCRSSTLEYTFFLVLLVSDELMECCYSLLRNRHLCCCCTFWRQSLIFCVRRQVTMRVAPSGECREKHHHWRERWEQIIGGRFRSNSQFLSWYRVLYGFQILAGNKRLFLCFILNIIIIALLLFLECRRFRRSWWTRAFIYCFGSCWFCSPPSGKRTESEFL